MVANTSATGGYLAPLPAPAPVPLEGEALLTFLTGLVSGITGLDGTLVRPAWQTEPPNIPDASTAWCAVAITEQPADVYAWVGELADGSAAQVQRQEILHVLCSFYDTGSGGLADGFAKRLRDGLSVPQNREPLELAGMGLVDVGDLQTAPVLFKQRWLYRVDLLMRIRSAVWRDYSVLSLKSAQASIEAEAGSAQLELNLEVSE